MNLQQQAPVYGGLDVAYLTLLGSVRLERLKVERKQKYEARRFTKIDQRNMSAFRCSLS
jgi:hypothetical protein